LPDHRGEDGRVFNRYSRAGLELAGVTAVNGSERLRVELQQYAVAGVVYERAARAWAELVTRRETGRGRRPSERQVERAARRLGLADQTLHAGAARLEELAARHAQQDPGALRAYMASRDSAGNGQDPAAPARPPSREPA
jgi:hypothetical protein